MDGLRMSKLVGLSPYHCRKRTLLRLNALSLGSQYDEVRYTIAGKPPLSNFIIYNDEANEVTVLDKFQ